MNSIVTKGIVLTRTDFGEADRIITFLTSDHGKLRAMAKGVRKSQSKLAGGIELFSISNLTFIKGRGEIYTLISTRLDKHFGKIVTELDRTQAGYAILKLLNRATEDQPESAYFDLLTRSFEALNDLDVDPTLTKLWFEMQLLKLSGHSPNLKTDTKGQALQVNGAYAFHFDRMTFQPVAQKSPARLPTEAIKFLRLGFSNHRPKALQRIQDLDKLIAPTDKVIHSILRTHLRT